METIRDTVLELGTRCWSLSPPTPCLLVVMKATFDLIRGESALLDASQEPCTEGLYHDDDPSQTVRYGTDFAFIKPRAEVLLMGSCHAPGSEPTTALHASFSMGGLSQELAIFGDRVWKLGSHGIVASPPEPFTAMALRWERAFGGPDFAANPVGRGITEGHDGQILLPNIEDPRQLLASPRSRPAPAGAFPIPSRWEARRGLIGTCDEGWQQSRAPFLPQDFDPAYFNVAPPELRLDGFWRGDEWITLRNLVKGVPELVSRLPGLRARAFVEWDRQRGGRFEEIPLRLDTVTLDTDQARALCLWRGTTDLPGRALEPTGIARLYVTDEPLDRPSSLEVCRAQMVEATRSSCGVEVDIELDLDASSPSLPSLRAISSDDDEALLWASLQLELETGDLPETWPSVEVEFDVASEDLLASGACTEPSRPRSLPGDIDAPTILGGMHKEPPRRDIDGPSLLGIPTQKLPRDIDGPSLLGIPARKPPRDIDGPSLLGIPTQKLPRDIDGPTMIDAGLPAALRQEPAQPPTTASKPPLRNRDIDVPTMVSPIPEAPGKAKTVQRQESAQMELTMALTQALPIPSEVGLAPVRTQLLPTPDDRMHEAGTMILPTPDDPSLEATLIFAEPRLSEDDVEEIESTQLFEPVDLANVAEVAPRPGQEVLSPPTLPPLPRRTGVEPPPLLFREVPREAPPIEVPREAPPEALAAETAEAPEAEPPLPEAPVLKIKNLTPYPIGYKRTSTVPPRAEMTIVVRGRFDLVQNGAVTPPEGLAPLVQGPLTDDVYAEGDDDRTGELIYPGDFADLKVATDVMVRGTCFTPGGKPLKRCPAAISVGEWKKALWVVGRRIWKEGFFGPKASQPAPFTEMPIGYARSFGGAGYPSNPVGVGLGIELPNVESAKEPIKTPRDRPPAAGFGPINPAWPSRASKMGREYGAAYKKTRAPFYASDFDWTYFNAAPVDQQLEGYLRGDEAVRLHNLHREHPVLTTRLPGERVRCFVHDIEGRFREIRMRLDTLFVDGNAAQLLLTWRGVAMVEDRELDDVSTILIAAERLDDEPMSTSHYQEIVARFEADPLELGESLDDGEPPPPGLSARGPVVADPALTPPIPIPTTPRITMVAEAPPEGGAEAATEAHPIVAGAVAGGDLSGRDLSGVDLGGLDLSGSNLSGATLVGASLRGANLARANLREALLFMADLTGANLSGADLTQTNAGQALLDGADLSRAVLDQAYFGRALMRGARLDEARGSSTFLTEADLSGASLIRVELSQADFESARIQEARFDGARLDRCMFYRCRGAGVAMPEAQLPGCTFEESELSGASFVRIAGRGSNWTRAVLVGANLSASKLEGALFDRVRADRARFDRAILTEARFFKANLDGAVFAKAKLLRADLCGCAMDRATFVGANLFEAKFLGAAGLGCDFAGANLERCVRPS